MSLDDIIIIFYIHLTLNMYFNICYFWLYLKEFQSSGIFFFVKCTSVVDMVANSPCAPYNLAFECSETETRAMATRHRQSSPPRSCPTPRAMFLRVSSTIPVVAVDGIPTQTLLPVAAAVVAVVVVVKTTAQLSSA